MSSTLKSASARAFEHFLRTGERLTSGEWLRQRERKFNPYHDPKNGQFTFGPEGVGLGKAAPRPKRPSGQQKAPMTQAQVEAHAAHAMPQYRRELARGTRPEEAAGWASNSEGESGGNPAKHQIGGGPGRGLYQWGSSIPALDRRLDFKEFAINRGLKIENIEDASADIQLDFRDWELAKKEKLAKKRIATATTVKDISRAITKHYVRPRDRDIDAEDRARIAEEIFRRASK